MKTAYEVIKQNYTISSYLSIKKIISPNHNK